MTERTIVSSNEIDELHEISVVVNGVTHTKRVPARRLLSDFVRHDLGLHGTHVGCEHGVCGACTVLLEGSTARSCLMLAAQVDGASIVTIEGLGSLSELHPIQQAFWDTHALQCGFCTPGVVISLYEFLRDNPGEHSEDKIREALGGTLCRCTGYVHIVKAAHRAAAVMLGILR